MLNAFRTVWYNTGDDDKRHAAQCNRHEYIADLDATLALHFALTKAGNKHVEVFCLQGIKQQPEKGMHGMSLTVL